MVGRELCHNVGPVVNAPETRLLGNGFPPPGFDLSAALAAPHQKDARGMSAGLPFQLQ